jgi:transposase InsO family protein
LKQTETSKILRELHADQGSEIITKELEKFLAENGTKLTTSVVNTPQHNSLIERANRTLLDMSV